jgi:hypothetical protein
MIYFENRRYAQKNPTTKIKRDRNQNIGEWSETKKPTAFCPCGFATNRKTMPMRKITAQMDPRTNAKPTQMLFR